MTTTAENNVSWFTVAVGSLYHQQHYNCFAMQGIQLLQPIPAMQVNCFSYTVMLSIQVGINLAFSESWLLWQNLI